MCGICGIINLDSRPADEKIVRRMMSVIKHRGPDDEGFFPDHNVGLGFVRLSIIDLSPKGHQPMHSPDRRYTIVFNGEIYNYVEIREVLKTKGYTFLSATDTEVLLNSYIEWGESCLERFNGMFSFVIYDKTDHKIFAARDRFGVKPFYYYLSGSVFIFSSEIPAILSVDSSLREPNDLAIYNYLVYNKTDIDDSTFYKDVRKLVHGHKLSIDLSLSLPKISISRWYNLRERIQNPFINPDDYMEAFSDSVRLRLRSDVPVSVCLSGGLDSSSILSVMLKKFGMNEVHTFSAVYGKGKTGDESEYIDIFKPSVRNMHFTHPGAESLYSELNSFIKAQAEPVQTSSIYAEYEVMKLIKEHGIKVAMIGQGADEQLGGYHYFFGHFFKEKLAHLQWVQFACEMGQYRKMHHSSLALQYLVYYLMPERLQDFLAVARIKSLNKNFTKQFDSRRNKAMKLYSSSSLRESFLDHFEFKLEHLLKWNDMNAMRFSVECRVPFLDYRLVERTIATGSEWIIKNGTTKFILREAMKGILPEEIRNRQSKVGFDTPENEWFRSEKFYTLVKEILLSSSFKQRGYINSNEALSLFEQHKRGKINISRDIWKWVNLEIWFRQFIDHV